MTGEGGIGEDHDRFLAATETGQPSPAATFSSNTEHRVGYSGPLFLAGLDTLSLSPGLQNRQANLAYTIAEEIGGLADA